jgi:hypothetical protein
MATWTARTTIDATPGQVLAVLTDPESVYRWSPVDFELERIDCHRLAAGCSAQVAGELAGWRVSFEVDVIEAAGGRFHLRASGPVELDVEYRTESVEARSEVVAAVSVATRSSSRAATAQALSYRSARSGAESLPAPATEPAELSSVVGPPLSSVVGRAIGRSGS